MFRDQCSLVHRLSAEGLGVPVAEGLHAVTVTTPLPSASAVALSRFVQGGGVLGRGTVIPARGGKPAAAFQCLLAPC